MSDYNLDEISQDLAPEELIALELKLKTQELGVIPATSLDRLAEVASHEARSASHASPAWHDAYKKLLDTAQAASPLGVSAAPWMNNILMSGEDKMVVHAGLKLAPGHMLALDSNGELHLVRHADNHWQRVRTATELSEALRGIPGPAPESKGTRNPRSFNMDLELEFSELSEMARRRVTAEQLRAQAKHQGQWAKSQQLRLIHVTSAALMIITAALVLGLNRTPGGLGFETNPLMTGVASLLFMITVAFVWVARKALGELQDVTRARSGTLDQIEQTVQAMREDKDRVWQLFWAAWKQHL